MVLKFSQQMKHAQRTEKYIRLIFNSYISDDDFFQKSMCYFFSGDFQGQEGGGGGVHYATLNTVITWPIIVLLHGLTRSPFVVIYI